MAEEQSSESDGYFTPEEELVCPKSEGCITSKEVSIMAGNCTMLYFLATNAIIHKLLGMWAFILCK